MVNELPDIPRLYTAIAEWAGCMMFIILLKPRYKVWKMAGISVIALILQALFLILTGELPLQMWVPCMMTAIGMMVLFLRISIVGSWSDAVYCGLQAFIIAEFAAAVQWQCYCYYYYGNTSLLRKCWALLWIYGLIYGVFWKLWTLPKLSDRMLHVRPGELAAVILIAMSVFAISNINFLPVQTLLTSTDGPAAASIRTITDFGGVAMVYAYFVQRCEIRARRELDVMQSVLQNQYLQYQQSKESIALINYKYHDLKHQIAVLRAEDDPQKRREFLDQMEDEIRQYEMQNKTGNKVVDTILTSKSVICEKAGITMNCVADGSLLDFMDTMDICSILGNALDNAIECEKKIEDSEKRLIHMAIFSQKNFVILRFENYFEGTLDMQDGIPVTTKSKKKEFHGFGIRSIRYTVNKYEGAVSITQRDNWFELKVLIPRNTAKD